MTGLFLFLLPAIVILLLCRGRLEVGLLAAAGLGQWLAGAYLTRASNHGLFAVVMIGTAAFLAGYVVAGRQRRLRPTRSGDTPSAQSRFALAVLGALTVILVVMHFVIGGVPLFSGDVETIRFQLASSGFFGIPSRAYLFGLPILLLAYAGLGELSRRDRVILLLLISSFVVSRLLGGLKSGLWEVTLVALLAHIVHTGSAPPVMSRPVVRRALLLVVAVLFAVYLGTQYSTVQVRSTRGAVDYLVYRLTVGTVGAGEYAVEGHALDRGGSRIGSDVLYYLDRYSSGVPRRIGLFVPPPFDTSRLISTGSQGLPTGTSAYVSPVAPGLAPSLFLDWRWLGVVVGMTIAGLVMRRLQWRAVAAVGLAAGVWAAAALVLVYILTNGSVAYYAINFTVVALAYTLGYVILSGTVGSFRVPASSQSGVESGSEVRADGVGGT